MKLSFQCAALIVGITFGVTGCSSPEQKPNGEAALNKSRTMIEPGIGVGKVRAHMTVEQVIAELGEPDNKTGHVLNYVRLGFSVVPTKDGIVRVIMCGDPSGFNSPLVRAFSGRTKDGIGMGSIRSDVINALGQPTGTEREQSGQEVLKYPQLGITFTLADDKVCHIIVDIKNAK